LFDTQKSGMAYHEEDPGILADDSSSEDAEASSVEPSSSFELGRSTSMNIVLLRYKLCFFCCC
jgi:hypothetical protein